VLNGPIAELGVNPNSVIISLLLSNFAFFELLLFIGRDDLDSVFLGKKNVESYAGGQDEHTNGDC
jgi:hypothetical protein